jgi:PAS domain S-box-containing protein
MCGHQLKQVIVNFLYCNRTIKYIVEMNKQILDIPPIDEELYALMLYNIEDYALVLLGPDGIIVSWNKGAEKIKGYTREEVINKHFSIFYTKEDIKNNKPYKNLQLAIENGFHEEEAVRLRKDGTKFFASVSITALKNHLGELRGFTKIVKDITNAKNQEKRLINSNDILETIVQERTKELTDLNKALKKEIAFRRKVEAERKTAAERIENSLKEKELLLKEIHHRVKNNLQIISSLLNIQSTYIKDKASMDVFKESQNRVRSMALIHEKLYQSHDMSQIDFSDYVKELVNNLFGSYSLNSEQIILHRDINNMLVGIDLAINLGLILNELVSNAFKHAFPDGRKGNLYITMNRVGNKCEMIVEDDGVGFPSDLEFRKTESLGLQLITTLVDQIGGTIDLSNTHGAKFTITFQY